ncbi:MAG: NAD-dependent succinate-semialdehyde dehydrogenase [Simkaniaceae bacterium]|nr:NAD-dependent succinate-semialdehyde dehydrogenase [Candidatus Sacchlamyda saccharinae]
MLEEFFKAENYGPFIQGSIQKGKEKLTLAGKEDVHQALDTAKAPEGSHYERSAILRKMADLLRENADYVARLITLEMGKTIRDAKGEVEYAASYFDWFAEEAKRIQGYTIPSTNGDKHISVQYEPVGLVAVITPWNFPIAMAARKIGPAIAAGCPCIVRPSSDTPLSMLAIALIAKDAGLPDGALSVLPGKADSISKILLADPRVRKLTFTGSTPVGEKLYGQCISTFKKVTMELGGHAPALIFEDADIERAVQEIMNAKLRNSGQTCVCANRIFIHQSILDLFVEALQKKLSTLKIGDPLDEKTDLTNVLHPSSEKKVKKQIADAIEKGARCPLKGDSPYAPTILTHVTKEMEIFTEETFGPVFAIIPFETEEEAVRLANDTIYGLAAYVFTRDLSRAHRVCNQLEYGIIGLNDGLPTTPQAPFGGVKYSGFGREGGPKGIYEYLIEKTVSLKL